MGFYSDAKYESSKKLNESIEKKKYLKEDAENSGHFIFKGYDNLPPRIVSTDNGAYDLEQKGLSGRYTWIGYQHKLMRTEQGMRQAVEDAANEIARRMKDEFGGDVKVEDKWKTTDMYRVYSVKELTESIRSRKALKEDDSTKPALNWEDWDAVKSLIKKSMGKMVKEIPQIEDSSYHYPNRLSFDTLDDIIGEVRSNLYWELDKLSPEKAEYGYGVFRGFSLSHGEYVTDKIKSGKMRLFNDYKEAINYAESITKPDGKQTRIYLIVGNGDNKRSAGYLWLKMLDPTERIELNSTAYNEILALVKGNKKAASILRKYLKYVTWESSEELEDKVDILLNDLMQEGGTSAKEAKIAADAVGWGLEDSTPSFPPIKYSVWELTEDGEETDELDRFDTEKEAISFAKKQPFPTHVVFLPEEDPDNDPDFAEYIEYHYDYEPYEVVWSSLEESLNKKKPPRFKEACRRRTEAFERRDFNDVRVVERSGEIQIGWPSYGVVSISEAKSFARDLQNAIDYAERQF